MDDDFSALIRIGDKDAKHANRPDEEDVIFGKFSLGVSTNRDAVVYSFSDTTLTTRVQQFCEAYNAEVDRYRRHQNDVEDLDEFLKTDRIKWSRNLKRHLKQLRFLTFDQTAIRDSLYRPFTRKKLYFGEVAVDEAGTLHSMLPNREAERENVLLMVPTTGNRAKHWTVLATNRTPNLNLYSLDSVQCFPFYVYSDDGQVRRENVTERALGRFQTHYKSDKISKMDVLHYVYAMLHHAGYLDRYTDLLRLHLPRLPFAPNFDAFATTGKRLIELHVDYENVQPYDLEWIETAGIPVNFRVEKMRASKDKRSIQVNDSLTLAGIPAETFAYQLGNRSALEWIVDQYRIKEDEHLGIVSNPNADEDPEYLVRLIGKVIRVSVETAELVGRLSKLPFQAG